MPSIEFYGENGHYMIWGNTRDACSWIRHNVTFEEWQGDAKTGIHIDGSRMAADIADAAVLAGYDVAVNRAEYRPFAA